MASQDTGSDLGIEASLFKAADKLRGSMEPSDYKHVVLGGQERDQHGHPPTSPASPPCGRRS